MTIFFRVTTPIEVPYSLFRSSMIQFLISSSHILHLLHLYIRSVFLIVRYPCYALWCPIQLVEASPDQQESVITRLFPPPRSTAASVLHVLRDLPKLRVEVELETLINGHWSQTEKTSKS